MTPARSGTAVGLAAVVTVLGWFGLWQWSRSGGSSLPLPWTAVVGTVLLALVVLAAGWPVRRWVAGRRDRPLDPLVAARTVVLAKAAAYGGALLVGWYLAQALVILPAPVGARRGRLLLAVLAALGALGVAAAGFVVQHWCRVPPDGPAPGSASGGLLDRDAPDRPDIGGGADTLGETATEDVSGRRRFSP